MPITPYILACKELGGIIYIARLPQTIDANTPGMPDTTYHTLYVNPATDPTFSSPLAPATRIYNNALNTAVFVTFPTVTMHPDDTVNLTVSCQSINQHTAISSVGFYTVAAPGVA